MNRLNGAFDLLSIEPFETLKLKEDSATGQLFILFMDKLACRSTRSIDKQVERTTWSINSLQTIF